MHPTRDQIMKNLLDEYAKHLALIERARSCAPENEDEFQKWNTFRAEFEKGLADATTEELESLNEFYNSACKPRRR